MKGKYELSIYDNKLHYSLSLERNITIIKGKSGTGKSTLYNMFEDLLSNSRNVGIHCNMKDKLEILNEKSNWGSLINDSHNKIFIADEFTDYITTLDFAKIAQSSDNYFIIISRSGRLKWLTYSVDCIYELVTNKCDNISVTKLYRKYLYVDEKIKPTLVITEDSNSGFEAMKMLAKCDILSAHGRDNVYNTIKENINKYSCIYVIVDGAAFGSCIGRLFPKFKNEEVYIFSPESFEFLLLLSDTFRRYLSTELDCTYDFCDSINYLSWERYYTNLLDYLCKHYYNFNYSKSKLDKFFKSDYFKEHLKGQIKDIF